MDLHRVAGTTGRALLALSSAAVLAGTGLAWGVQQQVSTGLVTSNAVSAPPVEPGREFTVLLVGLDARTDADGNPLPQALLDALHAGPDEGQLHTDTMILVHVPASADERAVAVSIPRDSYVRLADGSGQHKINSAYSRADLAAQKANPQVTGPALDKLGREAGRTGLIRTVEQLTGVSVDHYAEINLAGFVELTDTLGGVPVCLNAAAHDDYSGVDLPAGYQTVSGPGALAFVRQRHGLEGGDLDRIARQQAFIAGLAQRFEATGTLTDPALLSRLLDVARRHVVIDAGWDVQQALSQVGRLAGADIEFRTIPTGRPDLRTPVDGVAVQVDPAAVRAFVQEQFSGTAATAEETPGVRATSGTPTATPTPPPTATAAVEPAAAATPTRVITASGVPCVN
jgi:LCP family protein required for cell wall assembly